VEKPEQLAPAIAPAAAALLPTVIDVIVSRDESSRRIVAS
jgi:hypothetical protein